MSATILIVEDDKHSRVTACKYFESKGYHVVGAKDGVSGVYEFRAKSPDLVILDLHLPGVDGFGVLERIRASGSDTPVIVVTALYKDEEYRERAQTEYAVEGYIVKPYELPALEKLVQETLAKGEAGRSSSDSSASR